MRLVECVPNFSNGRDKHVIQEICDAISAVGQVYVIDVHSDHDHNRSVVTVIGDPGQVEEAVFSAVRVAAKLIDLDDQRGEHPRIGATDVVPFVPLRNIGMAECVSLARKLGERIGAELSIPVYMYGKAAYDDKRQHLPFVRRLQYEALKRAIHDDPSFSPDFGPRRLARYGATAVGARLPLIAFNVLS